MGRQHHIPVWVLHGDGCGGGVELFFFRNLFLGGILHRESCSRCDGCRQLLQSGQGMMNFIASLSSALLLRIMPSGVCQSFILT